MEKFIVICRDDDTPEGVKGGYLLATRRQFDTRSAAERYASTIHQGREPIVVECPKGLTYEQPVNTHNWDCCGEGPHAPGTVKIMRAGTDSNLVLCRACWQKELAYRRERNTWLEKFAQHSLPSWDEAEVYEA